MPIAGMVFVCLIIFVAHRSKRLRTEAQRDVQLALLNKFTTAEEMTRFLQTDEGRRLVDQLALPSEDDPRHQAVGLLIPGFVLTSLGLAFVVLHWVMGADGYLVPAIITGFLGLGFFGASGLALYLHRKLSLTKRR